MEQPTPETPASSDQAVYTTLIIIDDPRFDLHIAGTDLPEIPDRTDHIRHALRTEIGDENTDPPITWLQPRDATWELPKTVHNKAYVAHVRKQCKDAAENNSTRWILNNAEVCVTAGSEWAVLHAASAGVQAVDLIFSHDVNINVERVFCNTRPPGHHAFKGSSMGFCIFNNIWIAAMHALNHYGPNWDDTAEKPYTHLDYEAVTGLPRWKKVLVLDWDVHHGNGTEDFIMKMDLFHADRFMYIGTQQAYKTIWPKTGKPCENGGPHHNVNRYNFLPGDSDYEVKALWNESILPKIKAFEPHLILISCGFDAHEKDPLAKLNFSSEIYGWMTKQLRRICPRIISMLEGGYNCKAIAEAAVCHVRELI
jgi:acetoin utilization deacetylase AcuC-like enzyme